MTGIIKTDIKATVIILFFDSTSIVIFSYLNIFIAFLNLINMYNSGYIQIQKIPNLTIEERESLGIRKFKHSNSIFFYNSLYP